MEEGAAEGRDELREMAGNKCTEEREGGVKWVRYEEDEKQEKKKGDKRRKM